MLATAISPLLVVSVCDRFLLIARVVAAANDYKNAKSTTTITTAAAAAASCWAVVKARKYLLHTVAVVVSVPV